MSESLPGVAPPSPAVAALIRAGVERVVDAPAEWVQEYNDAMMHGAGMSDVAADQALARVAVATNMGNLARWASANHTSPGTRVPAVVDNAATDMIHEIVRRGLDAAALDAYRTAQNVAWRRWMEICFGLTDDAALLRELLEITAVSIATFIDDTVDLLAQRIAVARAQLAGDTHAQRRAAVALLLEGAPVADARA
ncbi:MAG: PucR family transcriptional regulator, partial [Gordonia sp. (in: high G+C Gram-positive bacteria)]